MPRLVITRPNGDTEYAELTRDKDLAGDNRLIIQKDGTDYWAKLDKEVSTHMYVIKPNGEKYYVQKEMAFKWKYVVDDAHPVDGFVIPRTGKYRIQILEEGVEYDGRPYSETSNHIYKFKKGTKPQYDWRTKIETVEGEEVILSEFYSSGEEEHSIYIQSIEYIGG